MDVDPTHTPTAEGELLLISGGYLVLEEDISLILPSPLVPPSSKSPASLLVLYSSKSTVSRDPSQPPSLTSSSKANQPVGPASVGTHQHLTGLLHFVPRIRLGSPGLQLRTVKWIPWLHLQPLIPSLHPGPSTYLLCLGSSLPCLHQRPSSLRLHRAPSSLRLGLGQTSLCLSHGRAPLPYDLSQSVIPLVSTASLLHGSSLPRHRHGPLSCLAPSSSHHHHHPGFSHCHLHLSPALHLFHSLLCVLQRQL
ncbi:uncharacterized protein LOC125272095 [Megalobrama amblycephala]|uniref:uncharacterized protein LOC125272095 n=1 Tax=Megalobrama amblycephala TaxID=75352 RepID=UPI0020144990|nr:uncharacterized protein LOC125272095 [Megalobrama amblycephala]